MVFHRTWIGVFFLAVSTFPCTTALLFVMNRSMHAMVAFSAPGRSCRVVTNRNEVMKTVLTMSTDSMIRAADDVEMDALIDACQQHNANVTDGQGGFIYPGTKWCGPGNIATNYEDLGMLTDVDRCCRDHDNCPVNLAAGKCNDNGLCNKSPFTRSDCKCDKQFQTCLQRVRSPVADTIGVIYFNIARIMCFTDSPECARKSSACPVRVMPYYKSSNELRYLKALITKLIRGFVKLKHAIFFPKLRLY